MASQYSVVNCFKISFGVHLKEIGLCKFSASRLNGVYEFDDLLDANDARFSHDDLDLQELLVENGYSASVCELSRNSTLRLFGEGIQQFLWPSSRTHKVGRLTIFPVPQRSLDTSHR